MEKINEFIKKQNEKIEETQGKDPTPTDKLLRPNIDPSSTYNY